MCPISYEPFCRSSLSHIPSHLVSYLTARPVNRKVMAFASLRVHLMFLSHCANQFLLYLTHPRPINCFPQDHDTAMSAVRNLNGADVGGRPLRIDLADSDPFLEGKTTVRGELIDSGGPDNKWSREDRRQGSILNTPPFLSNLPPGVQVPPGSTALDTISQSLATMEPSQLLEVLAQMKVCTKRLPPCVTCLRSDLQFCVIFSLSRDRHSSSLILTRQKHCLLRIPNWPMPSSRHCC